MLKQFETENCIRFWRGDNQPVEILSNAVIAQKLSYIHQNPVEKRLVFKPEDYVCSSARDYSGEHDLLDNVIVVDLY